MQLVLLSTRFVVAHKHRTDGNGKADFFNLQYKTLIYVTLRICYSVYRLCDYVLFYVPFMCYSLYCSHIFVNSITATGCQPICSLIIIIIIM